MRRILALISVATLLVALTAMPALAQNNGQQRGLINVQTGDVTVPVSVAAAANICGLDVNVVAHNHKPGETTDCSGLANA